MTMTRTNRKPVTSVRDGRAPAFTLVELLVVIGIIAVLIAILLPSLSKARGSARTVACAANLRSILQGMQIYVAQNQGYFPGGPNSSGAFLLSGGTFTDANCPEVSQLWDWQSPIAMAQGLEFERGGTQAERTARFKRLNEFPGYRCPDNDVLAVPFGAPNAGTVIMNSYNTAMIFHQTRNPANNAGDGKKIARSDYNPPAGYAPKISSVKNASRKIYIADGARYSKSDGTGPDYEFRYDGTYGGAYSDQGAWSSFSASWDRSAAPGNGGGTRDARLFAYRHGTRTQKAAADAFRFNAGFFDGHVEALGDLAGANPEFWMPTGTQVPSPAGQGTKDVQAMYFTGGGAYTAP